MPSTVKLLRAAFPSAELIDGEDMLRRIRTVKMPDEIDAISRAVRVTEDALAAAEAALAVGVTERQLTAVFMEAMATAGITTPTTQDVAWITSKTAPWSRSSRDTGRIQVPKVGSRNSPVSAGSASSAAPGR